MQISEILSPCSIYSTCGFHYFSKWLCFVSQNSFCHELKEENVEPGLNGKKEYIGSHKLGNLEEISR